MTDEAEEPVRPEISEASRKMREFEEPILAWLETLEPSIRKDFFALTMAADLIGLGCRDWPEEWKWQDMRSTAELHLKGRNLTPPKKEK